jgi:hypothetical protein
MLANKIFLISLGITLIADGIGSIWKQSEQPFFWWQIVRLVRAMAGVALITYGLFFV